MQRVLILRNQGIGDLILITPAIRAIRAAHPGAHIAIMVGDWSKSAIEGNTHLDEVIAYPDQWIQRKNPWGYVRLIKRLRKNRFDIAYIFHSHPFIHLMVVLAGIPRRYGFYDPKLRKPGFMLTGKTEWQPNTDRYIADNYLDIPRLYGWQGNDLSLDFVLSEQEQTQTDSILSEQGLKAKEYVVVAPGGGINPRQDVFEKRWGSDKYADLCKLILDEWQIPIVLTGSTQEIDIGSEIIGNNSGNVINLIGKIPFRLTAGIINRSQMLICNDSSVMHVAVAFGVPSLTIFGPSNPKSLLPDSEINQWITSGLDCSPCYCNSIFKGCDHLRCLTELSPDVVMTRLNLLRANILNHRTL